MASCFDKLVGITDVDCDCFGDDRPESTSVPVRSEWTLETFTVDFTGVFTTEYDLPDDMATHSQLFQDGVQLIEGTDYEATNTKEVTVTTPDIGATYQFWYYAGVPVIPYNESTSGLYITDLLPLEEVSGLASCENSVWAMYQRARATAIKEVVASINSAALVRNKIKYNTFSGYVGATEPTEFLTSFYAYCGVRIRTNAIRSGYLKINRIVSMFEKTGTVNLTVYAADGTVVTPTFEITTQANRKSITDVGLTLPLLGDFNTAQDYFLVFEYDSENRPKLNKTACSSCSGQTPITAISRYGGTEWASTYRGALAWNNYLIVGGWQGDSVADFSSAPTTVESYLNGLALDIEVGCDLVAGLCNLATGTGPQTMAVATAIQRRAASLLVDSRNNSSTPNRNNFVNREALESSSRQWGADYMEALEYIRQNVTPETNDCVICKPRISMSTILT